MATRKRSTRSTAARRKTAKRPRPRKPKADATVVAQLEKLLESVRAGVVNGVIVIGFCADGMTVTGWTGTGCVDVLRTLDAVQTLGGRMTEALLAERKQAASS